MSRRYRSGKKGRQGQREESGAISSIDVIEPVSEHLGNIYYMARLLVKGAALVLVFVFGWLQFKGVEFAPIAKELPADVVFKTSLALYYMCWVAGLLSDTDTQEGVYSKQPASGLMPLVTTAVLLTAVFGLMCWAATTYQRFAIVLTVFFLINIVTWWYLAFKFLPTTVRDSQVAFRDDPFKSEKLVLVYDRYLAGRWQWLRFAAGGIVVAAIDVLAFSEAAHLVGAALGGISSDLTMAGLLLAFVVLMESWIWLVRLRLWTALRFLDHLAGRYELASRG